MIERRKVRQVPRASVHYSRFIYARKFVFAWGCWVQADVCLYVLVLIRSPVLLSRCFALLACRECRNTLWLAVQQPVVKIKMEAWVGAHGWVWWPAFCVAESASVFMYKMENKTGWGGVGGMGGEGRGVAWRGNERLSGSEQVLKWLMAESLNS